MPASCRTPRGADPGALQQRGRPDRSGAQDGLCARQHLEVDLALPERHAHAGASVELEARVERLGDDHQVAALVATLQERMQERLRCVPADAPLLIDFEVAATRRVTAVEVARAGNAGLFRGVAKRVEDFPVQTLLLDPPLAAVTVETGALRVQGRGLVTPFDHLRVERPVVLALAEKRQDVVPTPSGVAGGGPVVVGVPMAAHVDHAVDRRRAAENLAARIDQATAVEAGLGLGAKAPVGARIVDAVEIADRDVDPCVIVHAAGLDHEHREARVGGQAVRENAPGGARADDDVVEGAGRRHVSGCAGLVRF